MFIYHIINLYKLDIVCFSLKSQKISKLIFHILYIKSLNNIYTQLYYKEKIKHIYILYLKTIINLFMCKIN